MLGLCPRKLDANFIVFFSLIQNPNNPENEPRRRNKKEQDKNNLSLKLTLWLKKIFLL